MRFPLRKVTSLESRVTFQVLPLAINPILSFHLPDFFDLRRFEGTRCDDKVVQDSGDFGDEIRDSLLFFGRWRQQRVTLLHRVREC